MKKIYLAIFYLAGFCIFHPGQNIYAAGETVRIIFVTGANDGGSARQTLRYAVSDASEFLQIFLDMGGVSQENSIVALNPDRNNFLSSFRKFNQKIADAKKQFQRVESFFYYSGHSDEEGILLGNEKVYYKEIKTEIDSQPADVRIAILDSCSSGAFTMAKGGKMKSPFLMDSSNDMKGFAFMTSSSYDEFSQESDAIKGSFFTHFLLAGLRGAADVTMDKKISLNEAYQYAYSGTLSRTEKTLAGPQHPNYHIQMIGTGDVVLTDIRKSASRLIFLKGVSGRLSIRDQYGILIGEFQKPFGSVMEFGIDAGNYTIINANHDVLGQLSVSAKQGNEIEIQKDSFIETPREKNVARGNSSEILKNQTENQPSSLLGQEKSTLTWNGGAIIRMANIEDSVGLLMGVRGGATLNETLGFGFEGYGLLSPFYGLGYGGLYIEYIFFPKKLISFSTALLLGAGNYPDKDARSSIQNAAKSTTITTNPGGIFWIAEPEINVYINITPRFRIGLGTSYRLPLPKSGSSPDIANFQGFSGGLFILFGRF